MTYTAETTHTAAVNRARALAAQTVVCPHCGDTVAESRLSEHIEIKHKDILLAQCEEIIDNGLKIFMQVWQAFQIISEQRLYQPEYATFTEYCQRRWNMSRQRGYQLINFVKVMGDVSTIVDAELLPQNEAQARELVPFTSDERRIILQTVNAAAAELGVPVTARLTKEVGKLCATGLLTGTLEAPDGQIALNTAASAQITAQVYEAMQRQKTHIQANAAPKTVLLNTTARIHKFNTTESHEQIILSVPKGTDLTALRNAWFDGKDVHVRLIEKDAS